jgi:hypothetical protein
VQLNRATITGLLLGVTTKRNAASIRTVLAHSGYTLNFAAA